MSAWLLVVNQLEVIRLRLAVKNGFEHCSKLLVPRSATEVKDSLPDTFFGRESKHRVEGFVRCANLEFRIQNEQCFAARGAASH